MSDLSPEQIAKIHRKASSYSSYALWITGGAWLIFLAAVWYGSWKLAGIGALFMLPAVFLALVAHAMRTPETRQRIAERIRQTDA
ncbi:hypothetical protein Skr01_36420 [Sphaerisporangium krabiense]|uniref:ABC-type bacteriocin/lantibiotic exporter with double-glycine peptidase domain n=1 Tax=Sphaerisporangium krabiense TaxID=763782 RepID=A0A7W9DQN7_9ACTN|nr:hypothetical protein [Sphaerisporangium krabiense]MBB5626635.1 ABC-type bacteriocin/lantibiotic exporter with double-glycine peptidase domain [Sphaerisporangium krabiense]GII63557.1 hypothetical protein Skr01_36420 [Sphaerisporangium krabiense]